MNWYFAWWWPGGLALMLLSAGASGATRTHFWGLNGTYADALGGTNLEPQGGNLIRSGYYFPENQALNLVQAVNPKDYSIVMVFFLSEYASFKKLIDFKHLGSDYGLYNYSGTAYFYPIAYATNLVFEQGKWVHLAFTRDGRSAQAACFVNGAKQFGFFDANEVAVFSGPTNIVSLLADDTATGRYESAPGFVDYVELFEGALSDAEVAWLYQGEPPRLTINFTGGDISVAWTNLVFGYQLETATNAAPAAVWRVVDVRPAVAGLRYSTVITNDANHRRAFYRLRKDPPQ
jgi:hypothetical protein